MALYKVDIEKLRAGEYWTNVYHVEAATLLAAVPIAAQIKEIERNTHRQDVTFTKARISDAAPGGDHTTVVYNQPGLSLNNGEVMPLFNTVRVDFTTFGKRPNRKYLRLPLAEDQTTGINLSTAMMTFMNNTYCIPMEGVAGLRTSTGGTIDSADTAPAIQMRQLRRGSRRRTQPIL